MPALSVHAPSLYAPEAAPTAESFPERSASPFRTDVQGLRALAMLLVLGFHARLVPGGFVGVDVFFVISGFVITGLLHRELVATGRIALRHFYVRRIRRLLPALSCFIVVVLALSVPLLSPLGAQQTAASTGRATSLFAGNISLYRTGGYFDTAREINPFLHMWSLAVEEQFYLLFPVGLWLVWLIVPARMRRFGVPAVLGAVAVASFAGAVYFTRAASAYNVVGQPVSFAFYLSPLRAWEFLAGALVPFVSLPVAAESARLRKSLYWVAGIALVVVGATYGRVLFPGASALAPVIAAMALIGAGSAPSFGSRLLSGRLITWLGDRSYSWYLWHWPLIVYCRLHISNNPLALLIAGLLGLVPAVISFNHVEQPIRLRTNPSPRRTFALAGACVALPAVLATSLLGAANKHWGIDNIARLAAEDGLHQTTLRNCTDGALLGSDQCLWTVTASRHSPVGMVALIGDSNAGQFAEPVIGAANARGLDVTASTTDGCPIADVFVETRGGYDRACRAGVTRLVERTLALKPAAIVISLASDGYLDNAAALRIGTGSWVRKAQPKADVLSKGLRRIMQRFEADGIPVVLVHPVPRFYQWDLNRCGLLSARRPTSCGRSVMLAAQRPSRALAIAAEKDAVAGLRGVVTVDFADQLCPNGMCVTNQGREWLYRDGFHLSVRGATTLRPQFEQLLHTVLDH